MKIIRKIFWLFILLAFVGSCIGGLYYVIAKDAYANNMKSLDPSTANGSLITAYDTAAGEYFDTYLPKELKAKKPSQVGYILNVTYGTTTRKYSGGGYAWYSKEGETISAQLIDCSTGNVIARHYFEAYFPERVEMSEELTVDASAVAEWLTHVYPEWPEGKAPDHNYGPEGCTVCGQLPNQPEPTEAPTVPETTAAATESAEKDWDAEADSLPTGTWKLDYVMDAATFDMVSVDGGIKFQIHKDHSSVITTAKGKYNYTWQFSNTYYDEEYDEVSLYYSLTEADGDQILFVYYPADDSVAIFTDAYSVFFTR